MKISLDDPRLTAYAMDELDAAGRKAIETELEISVECRREVEEIGRTALLLKVELASEPLPELSYAQQLAIEAKLKPGSGKKESLLIRLMLRVQLSISSLAAGSRLWSRSVAIAAAAVIFVTLSVAALFVASRLREPRYVATAIGSTISSDEAFDRWAEAYRRLRIPLVPMEEVPNYRPHEVLPIVPTPTKQNSKS